MYDAKIFHVTKRSTSGSTRQVAYEVKEFEIPICSICKETHKASEIKQVKIAFKYLITGIIAGIAAACFAIFLHDASYWCFFWFPLLGGMLLTILGNILGLNIYKEECRNSNVYPYKPELMNKHPLFAEIIKKGWSFKQPSA